MQAAHPIRNATGQLLYNAAGQSLCCYCSRPTSHYVLFVCNDRIRYRCCGEASKRFDATFLKACGIAVADPVTRGAVTVEIVMQGAAVRKARELHALRNRKPLMGERRATGCGEVYLGDLS